MDVNEITDTHSQFTKGDTEIVPGFGEPNIYCDDKANHSESENLLVEMIQSAATPEEPRWLGWFYNLTECDFVLMGYYDGKDSLTLKSVFKIDLKKLRAWFRLPALKKKMLNKEIKVTSNFCVTGWGITLLMFIIWMKIPAIISFCSHNLYTSAKVLHFKFNIILYLQKE